MNCKAFNHYVTIEFYFWSFFLSFSGQISFEKTDENEIFDTTFGKFIAGADLPNFSNNDPGMSKFGMISNEQGGGMSDNLKVCKLFSSLQCPLVVQW